MTVADTHRAILAVWRPQGVGAVYRGKLSVIRFENVSKKYDGQRRAALDNIDVDTWSPGPGFDLPAA